jgi:hypothetical protein
MAQQRRARLAVLLVAAAGLGAFAWFGPTGIRQARWMAESREILPTVEGRLASEKRFAGLTAFVSTGCNIVIIGNVGSETDAQDVRAASHDITFPHGVLYRVRVE